MDKKMLSPDEITTYVEQVGVKKANNKSIQTLVLGILAGVFIALGAYTSSVASHGIGDPGLQKFVAGIVFPVGLILVLICGAELFTGNSLLSIAWAQKKITTGQMFKNWGLVWVGNFIGSAFVAVLVFESGLLSTGTVGGYAIKVAATKANIGFGPALASGILCNIIVCLSVWGTYASKDVTGKIFMGFFPVFAFVIGGFEHCVANMYYFTIGLLAKTNPAFVEASHISAEKLDNLNIGRIFSELLPVTIGNIIGGALCIGLVYWFIYRKCNEKKEIISMRDKLSV
ncbi:formate/nitrite transporter family protein [Clostridium sp.]|uniref:formate/nitrite transporter family protein n=1 Tax=Clostridium sp. TaxID=1506 RepID=UPI003216A4B9